MIRHCVVGFVPPDLFSAARLHLQLRGFQLAILVFRLLLYLSWQFGTSGFGWTTALFVRHDRPLSVYVLHLVDDRIELLLELVGFVRLLLICLSHSLGLFFLERLQVINFGILNAEVSQALLLFVAWSQHVAHLGHL